MLRKRYVAILVCSAMLLVASCDDARSPGVFSGSDQLRAMKSRVFIATMAMSALLQEDPNADYKVVAERSFEIADAMIDEAEKVDEDTSPE